MKNLVVIALALGLGAGAAHGQPGKLAPRGASASDGRTMSATEVGNYFEPYAAGTRACYFRNARSGGELKLDMIVHRDGSVFALRVATPDVNKRASRAIDACIQKLATAWHFPPRPGFTHAVVPFLFQKTDARGAGPIPSCWSARGCRTRR